MKYDSRDDTNEHIKHVRAGMYAAVLDLMHQAADHDESKLVSPEKEIFDEYTPKLKGTTYGSDEYKKFMEEMKVGLDHHYLVNRHHPEHFVNGIDGMNLMDLIEMVCDWLAAVKRHDDGDIMKSIAINKKRFGMTDQLAGIISNTVKALEVL